MKTCSLCMEEKPLDEFYKQTKDRHHSRCKECFKKKQYKYYNENKNKILMKYKLGYYDIYKIKKSILNETTK